MRVAGVGRLAAAIALAAIAVIAVIAIPARADRPYARPARLAYVAGALDAVRSLGPQRRRELDQQLRLGARRRCRAGHGEPPPACLVDLGRASCGAEPPARRPACHLAADVMLTNQLSEAELVDEATRLRFVNQGGDYRAAMSGELWARYATLAAELALGEPGPDSELPARIDRFCAGRGRALAWQRCAAAIVWYIGAYDGSSGP